jgi:hypothetical protein
MNKKTYILFLLMVANFFLFAFLFSTKSIILMVISMVNLLAGSFNLYVFLKVRKTIERIK